LAALLLRAANALQRFSATDKNGVRAQHGFPFGATALGSVVNRPRHERKPA
jgi:hypothetical protein